MRRIALALLCLGLLGCAGSDRSPEDVVRAWSDALNAGDNEAAADLFARGAEVVQGDRVVRLATREDAVNWNASLPCSGKIVEIATEGDTVTATFLLDDREFDLVVLSADHVLADGRIEVENQRWRREHFGREVVAAIARSYRFRAFAGPDAVYEPRGTG